MFFFIRRLGPSIYCLPPKYIGNISQTQKIFVIFGYPKNIPILHMDLKKKKLKYIENDPLNQSSFVMIYPQNLHTSKIMIFLKPPKILKFKVLNPKNGPSLRIYLKISEYLPPPPHTHTFLGHQDVKSGRYKNKIKNVTPITIKV